MNRLQDTSSECTRIWDFSKLSFLQWIFSICTLIFFFFFFLILKRPWGLPWQSSGWDSVFPPQEAQIWSLVREVAPTCQNWRTWMLQLKPSGKLLFFSGVVPCSLRYFVSLNWWERVPFCSIPQRWWQHAWSISAMESLPVSRFI